MARFMVAVVVAGLLLNLAMRSPFGSAVHALLNGGYLPLDVSIATTVLALLTFVLVAPLLPRLLSGRDSGG